MEPRPILNQFAQGSVSGTADGAQNAGEEGRVVTRLPNWDLLPAQTLLVRRRGAPMSGGVAPVPLQTEPPIPAVSPMPTPAPAHVPGPAPMAVSAPTAAPVLCRQYQQPLEDGSAFCSECGTQQ